MESILDIIETLTEIFLIINVILFVYSCINQKPSRSAQLLTLYTISLFVIHFLSVYVKLSDTPNNLYLSHYHFGFQFLLLSLFYRTLFTSLQKKWVTIIMIIVFGTLTVYYSLSPEKYFEFNLIDIFITTIPLIFFSITHLHNMLTQNRRFFIFNAGVLIYLSTSTLIFFLGTFWNTEKEFVGISSETARNIWNIYEVIYLAYLIFITVEWKTSISKWKVKNK